MGTEKRFDITCRDLLSIRERFFGNTLFDVNPEGGVELYDPLSGERLMAGQVPPCVTTSPSLSAGLEFLKERGGSKGLTIQLMLADHGASHDWEVMAESFGEVMERAGWFGVEMSWTGPASPDLARAAHGAPEGVELRLAEGEGRRAFQEAQLAWLRARDPIILPCELADEDTTALSNALARLWEITEHAEADSTVSPGAQHAAERIGYGLFTSVRKWILLAQLGHWLQQLDAAGNLPKRPIEVPLMLGSWHAESIHRLTSLGVPTEEFVSPDYAKETQSTREYGEAWRQFNLDMRTDIDFLRTPIPQ